MKSSTISVTDMFCGAGGSSTGAKRAGADIVLAMNHWSRAIETHNSNHPEATHVCADIRESNPRRYPATTILIASPECFPAGTLVLAKRGYLPIEQIQVGDEVLTHQQRWRRVNKVMQQVGDTVVVKGRGHYGLEMTANHPIWARHCTYPWNNERRSNERVLAPAEWQVAGKLTNEYFWAMPTSFGDEQLPIPEIGGRGMPLSEEFWWIVGRWLGDGNLRQRVNTPKATRATKHRHRPYPALCVLCGKPASPHVRYPHLAQKYCSKTCKNKAETVPNSSKGSSVQICCAHEEAEELRERLDFAIPQGVRAGNGELRWSRRELRTATLFDCPHNGLVIWLLENFGQHAHGKHLPAWAFTMPQDWRRALIEGYLSADGHNYRKGRGFSTVSRDLLHGMVLLALSLGYHPMTGINRRENGIIEGRAVKMRQLFTARWLEEPQQNIAEVGENHVWGRITNVTGGRSQVDVYNLSVDEDESYIAEGIVVHNCTSHALAKGKRRKQLGQPSLFGNDPLDPAEERSRATMWDVPRFAEIHDYDCIIVENVVDICFWRMLPAWIEAMHLLGYQHQFVFFNSMFAWPTPQSRDRFYGVFWKAKNHAPDLTIMPLAHCAKCEKDIHSIQSWKDQGKKWGRYGKHGQYLYRCPSCASAVTPYYFCAANAIDWSITAPRIGDRKRAIAEKTRQRVRAGLTKFRHNPFTVELNKTTDRLRGLDSAFQTMTCDNSQAVVAPFLTQLSHDGAGRLYGLTGSFPTQTARDDIGLAMPFMVEQHGTSTARAITDPLGCIMAGGEHHALAMPFLMNADHSSGVECRIRGLDDPMQTQTARDQHGVVMPPFLVRYFTPRGGNEAANALNLDDAMPTMTANYEHYGLAVPQAFTSSYYGSSDQNHDVREVMGTLTSHDRHALVEVGATADAITEEMIDDCGFRMLEPHEIQTAMAFPRDYAVTGNRREKVKQLGNAVTPPVMELLVKRCIESLEGVA